MKILTHEGFKPFDGFSLQGVAKKLLRITYGSESLDCTFDHRMLLSNGKFIEAKELSVDDILYPNKIITSIDIIEEDHEVYDAINVEGNNSYITNGVVSHNCDEFAFVDNDTEFYTSTYPVISSGKTSRVIITSTANGIGNVFHKIWEGATQGINEFKPFRVDWWDVPGRDEEWKKQTISNTSEMQFAQEFGNSFLGSGDTLISAEYLLKFRSKPYKSITSDGVMIYEQPIKDHSYVVVVDVAKGRGQDYSTFNVIDISTNPFRQVAVYRNNLISPILFPNIIYKYANSYNQAMVVVESNDAGQVVCNGLYHDLEYENMFVESAVKSNSLGLTMTRKVKRIGCSSFKDLVESSKIEICDADTIQEISTFVARGQSYEASTGNHDDLVMNLILFSFFIGTSYFGELTDIDIKQLMFEQRMKEIEDDVLPFGFIDDGLQDVAPTADPGYEDWGIGRSYDF